MFAPVVGSADSTEESGGNRMITPVVCRDARGSHPVKAAAPSALQQFSKGTQIAGGIITVGFGLCHFFIPSMFGWWPYFEDDPDEMRKAVGATNFFFSASLSIIGGMSIVLPTVFPEAETVNTVWLWTNTALWTARLLYQAIEPQGIEIPGMATAMLIGFAVTDLLFLFSAVVSTFF